MSSGDGSENFVITTTGDPGPDIATTGTPTTVDFDIDINGELASGLDKIAESIKDKLFTKLEEGDSDSLHSGGVAPTFGTRVTFRDIPELKKKELLRQMQSLYAAGILSPEEVVAALNEKISLVEESKPEDPDFMEELKRL